MIVTHVVYDPSTFGITQRSLKMLRDTISEKVKHRIVVVQIPTDDICCGYFIFDWEWQNATWTGDGFRTDEGGEGGAGFKSAEIFFKFFKIWPIACERMDLNRIYILKEPDQKVEFLKLAQEIANALNDEDFKRPVDNIPEYVR
jgi:hypothetical protein